MIRFIVENDFLNWHEPFSYRNYIIPWAAPKTRRPSELTALHLSLQKTRDAEEGCRGGTLPFPRGANVPFLIFGKYLRYLKKSLYVRFMRRKSQIMNSLKRVRPQTPAPPPIPHSHRSTVPAKNWYCLFNFQRHYLFSLFLPKIARVNCAAEDWREKQTSQHSTWPSDTAMWNGV